MCRNRFLMAFAVGSMTLGVASAGAVPITFEFGGVVDSVSDPHSVLHGEITPESSFSGSFTFDSTPPDSEPDDPELGLYESSSATSHVQIGSLLITAPTGAPHTITVFDGPSDRLSMSNNGYEAGGFQILELGVSPLDRSATVFSSDALPTTAPEPVAFDLARFHLAAGPSAFEDFDVLGTVTYFTPEPGALVLFVTAMALVLFRRKP